MTPMANHLYQSTLFAGMAWLLTLAFRNNRAAIRYWLWLAASVKFLLPFSLLASLCSRIGWHAAPLAAPPPLPVAIAAIGQPFASPIVPGIAISSPGGHIQIILLTVWVFGILAGLVFWARAFQGIRAMRRTATPLPLGLPIRVFSSPARMEPGIIGICNPVLILPAGLAPQLTPAQFDAVIAHELAHARRRDNLTAALHLLSETIFWFHPLLWLVRTKLVAERERACDEEVLARTTDPHIYAEAIVNVCKHYIQPPLLCVSGIGGADLKQRVCRILDRRIGHNLSLARKFMLTAIACAAIAVPVAAGLLWGQPAREFDAVSIKLYQPKGPTWEACNNHSDPVIFRLVGCNLRVLVMHAYDLKSYQMSQKGPPWIDNDRFEIQARSPAPASRGEMMKMLQPVLADRFHLAIHWQNVQSPALLLEAAGRGPKLTPATKTDHCGEVNLRTNKLWADCLTLDDFADLLQQSFYPDNPVFNRTGLGADKRYEFKMDFNTSDDPAAGPSIASALEEQLGLRLKAGKAPVRKLLIDRVAHPQPN